MKMDIQTSIARDFPFFPENFDRKPVEEPFSLLKFRGGNVALRATSLDLLLPLTMVDAVEIQYFLDSIKDEVITAKISGAFF